MDLDAYRVRAEALARALNAAHHAHATGRTASADVAAICARHAPVVSRAAVDALMSGGHRRLARFAVECRLTALLDGRPAEQRVERVRAEARALGWPSARAMWAQLAGADLHALSARAEALVAGTAAPRPSPVPLPVDPQRLLAVAPVEHVDGLPRAFCAALDVPGDVRVVIAPDAPRAARLHEAGHALLLRSREPDAPFEDRYLTDRAEAEATAYAAEAHDGPLDAARERRAGAALLRDLAVLDHGVQPELAAHVERADPLLRSLDYFSAFSTAPRTDLRLALRRS